MSSTGSLLYVHATGVGGGGHGAVDALESEYEVVEAEGGVDAIKRLAAGHGAVDCVVVETAVSDLSLDALVDRIGREAPAVTVVVVGRLPSDPAVAAALVDVDAYVPEGRPDLLVERVGRLGEDGRVDRAVERHRRLAAEIGGIAADVATAEERTAIEASVHDRLLDGGGYRHVWIGRHGNDDRLSLTAPVAGTLDEGELRELVGGGDPTFVSRAIETSRVVSTVGSVPTRGGTAAAASSPVRDGGTGQALSSAAVPFVHDGRVVGLGLLSTDREDAFDSAERALLADLGAIVGHAIWALETADAEHDPRAIAENMENLVHELRNPLGIAQSHLMIAREDDDPAALDRVESALERLADTIDRATIGVGGDLAVEESAGDLREDVTLAWGAIDAPGVDLEVTDTVRFVADHDLVVRLLANLLQNAVEHGGDEVDVRVGTLPGGFYVEDDGAGIPPEEREVVLQRGYSTAADGLGIGLNIVDDVASAHGWDVTITEGQDGGARFEVTGVEETSEADQV